MSGSAQALDVQAQQIALACIYQLRQSVADKPELRLLAAKALLEKVRTMVEDLEQSFTE